MPEKKKHTNLLIHEKSPYLLQHAHNPVDWHPWNGETLEKALSLDKMLLISIGYSACHWCHVMEHESFSDEKVAALMNENFICIKVDREERPDVDQVYMDAVQLITGSGGWPLNCFTLPDGRPFFGGTYFRKEQWIQLLENISQLYDSRRESLEKQADELTRGIRDYNLVENMVDDREFSEEDLRVYKEKLKKKFDRTHGGLNGAPKFPMPSVYHFILGEYRWKEDADLGGFLELSLEKMAFGGIYDQLGGGFARYSTDLHWKVPHFEKMLYDNAQMVSVYARAYNATGNALYKEVVEETLGFIGREMTHPDGGFYSALDADSEGREGKYYTWTEKEIREVLGSQADPFIGYYRVGKEGSWHGEGNILLRTTSPDHFAREHKLRPSTFRALLASSKKKLLRHREKRVRPATDDKVLLSWNALMAEAYVHAYRALGKKEYLEAAIKNIDFILSSMTVEGTLHHAWKNGEAYIPAFLEDHSYLISALLELYQATFDDRWLSEANRRTEQAIDHFHTDKSGFFNYTSRHGQALIVEKKELFDNVMPSANAVMARDLFLLGQVMLDEKLRDLSLRMVRQAFSLALQYPSSFTYWAATASDMTRDHSVVGIIGDKAVSTGKAIYGRWLPACYVMASTGPSSWPQLKNKYEEGKTKIYACTWEKCTVATEDPEILYESLHKR